MLPSSKRPPRNLEPSEVIRTGDYEVVHSSPSSKRSGRTERPRVFEREVDDEERTQLFTGSTRSMLPPRPTTPVQTPVIAKAARTPDMNLRGLVRSQRSSDRPAAERPAQSLRGSVRPRIDEEDRTMLRPMSTMPPASTKPASQAPPAPAPRPPSARPPAMMPTPYMPFKPGMPVTAAVNAPGGSDARKAAASEPPGDPPSSVITAKTRVVRARSSMSWAAGLMALGAIVGLITAVVARGDADAIIDATASFVDPSHASVAHANGAPAQAAVLPSFVDTAHKTAPLGTDQNPAQGACLVAGESTVSAPIVVNTAPPAPKAEARTASISGADPSSAARPTPPKPAPVAYAAPVRAPKRAAAPPAAPVAQESSPSSGWLANVTPPNAGGPIARPSKAAKGGADFESAAAADALAKAQLEASLR
ncbi:MAG TPA: hypothetical protein VIF15_02105 [Polyangiaceae bacterium]|jgi:hypothetical protein